jgi:hypothetical protein
VVLLAKKDSGYLDWWAFVGLIDSFDVSTKIKPLLKSWLIADSRNLQLILCLYFEFRALEYYYLKPDSISSNSGKREQS